LQFPGFFIYRETGKAGKSREIPLIFPDFTGKIPGKIRECPRIPVPGNPGNKPYLNPVVFQSKICRMQKVPAGTASTLWHFDVNILPYQPGDIVQKGPSKKDVPSKSGLFDPLPPTLVRAMTSLLLHKCICFVNFGLTPPSPPTWDVLYGCPPVQLYRNHLALSKVGTQLDCM